MSILDQIFAQFESLDPDSSDWEGLDSFFESLRELREKKRRFSAEAFRAQIRERLTQFSIEHGDLIAPLGYDSMSRWSLADLNPNDLRDVGGEVITYLQNLAQYIDSESRLEDLGRPERMLLLRSMESLSKVIALQFERLNSLLLVEDAGPVETTSSSIEQVKNAPGIPPAKEEAQTSQELRLQPEAQLQAEKPTELNVVKLTEPMLSIERNVELLQPEQVIKPPTVMVPEDENGATNEAEFIIGGADFIIPQIFEDVLNSKPETFTELDLLPIPESVPVKLANKQNAPVVPSYSGDMVLMRSLLPQRTVVPRTIEQSPDDEEIKRLLAKRPGAADGEQMQQALLEYVANNYLQEAYWIALILETTGISGRPYLSSQFIKALYTSEWVRTLWPQPAEELLNDLDTQLIIAPQPEELSQPEQWLSVACVLLPALLATDLNFSPRLRLPGEDLPELGLLVKGVQEFCTGAHIPYLFSQLRDYLLCEANLLDSQKKAVAWLEVGPTRRTSHPPTNNVWIELCSGNGPVGKSIAVVAYGPNGNKSKEQVSSLDHVDPTTWKQSTTRTAIRKAIRELRDILEIWQDPDEAEAEIQERNRTIAKDKGELYRVIINPALSNVLEFIDEAFQIVQQWVDSAETILQRQDDLWDLEDRLEWMHGMQGHVEAAAEELNLAEAGEENPSRKTVLTCLRRAIYQLRAPFCLNKTDQEEALALTFFLQPTDHLPENLSVQDQLTIVPTHYPELLLEPNGEPVMEESNLVLLASLLIREPRRPIRLAVRGWCAQQDYGFINRLIEQSNLDEDERRDLINIARNSFSYDLRQLKRMLDNAREIIEQAMLDNIISEDERAQYIGLHREFESRAEAAEHTLQQGKFTERMAVLQSEIQTRIIEVLTGVREAILNEARKHWPDTRELLENRYKLGELAENDFLDVVRLMEESLNNGTLRTINDITGSITRFLNNKGNLLDILVRQPPLSKALDDYQSYRPAISRRKRSAFLESFQDMHLEDGRSFSRQVDEKKRNRCLEALRAWDNMYVDYDDLGQMQRNVETLMNYLGFETIGAIPETTAELSAALHINITSWRMTVRPHQVVPIPHVSSAVLPAWTYNIIGIWESFGINIINILRNLKTKTPYILLYFGTLTETQISAIRQMALKRDLYALVLDEPLMIYLGFEETERLQAFFECTLPYTSINPFMGRKGDTSHEMFFGRTSERGRLEDPNGPASIFGGRWIGKTALLHEIIYHNQHPEQKSFAVLTDLTNINTNGHYHLSFWNKFAEALEQQQVINLSANKSISYDDLLELLYQEIHNRGLRVLAMFDEADDFLSNDAGHNFQVVLSLLRLSVRTGWNFKAIYSGVHNVQGFSRIPNQPLAQLGTPVELGPLDPRSASDLLRRPLHSLGYRFDTTGREAEALPLYALSYTNYHPALIQSFGRWLVDHMRQSNAPYPCLITRQDIEAVACKQEVREEIRDRFNATLKLDYKYYCITLHMILDQWDKNNGFQRRYSANEIYEAMQKVWPLGFEGVDPAAVELLLQEMRGLGILSMDNMGSYYLRSPNVIGLVGNYGQFEAEMEAVRNMVPFSAENIKCCHQAFSPEMREYSPLTNQQLTSLFKTRSGLGVVFGSDALGIDHIATVVKDMASPTITISEKAAAWDEVTITARSGSALKDWMEDFINRNLQASNIYIYRRIEGTLEEMLQQFDAANSTCRRHSSPVVRVIFSINSFSAWDWFQLPKEERQEYEENKASTVLWLRRWDMAAVQQRLERAHPDNIAKKEWAERIYEATGGWHLLVEEFFDEFVQTNFVTAKNILGMVDRFDQDLREPNSALRKRFLDSLGLFDQKLRYVIEKFLKEPVGVPDDTLPLLFEADSETDRAVLGNSVCETAERAADYLEQMGVIDRNIDPKHNTTILVINQLVARLWR